MEQQTQTEQPKRQWLFSKPVRILAIATLAFYLIGAVFLLTSCEKDKLPDKPITVQVQTQGLIVKPLTKSFSVDEWVFNYNPNQYELKFTGTHGNTYTYNKSIAELQTGFPITVLPDNYNVTYQSKHTGVTETNLLSNTLDIKINDIKNINTITPVVLTANNDDYLIVVDINDMNNAQIMQNGIWESMFTVPNDIYRYAYLNQLQDLDIRYTYYSTVENGNRTVNKTLTNPQLNNIYHMLSTFNGESNINILPFNYNVVGW